MHSPRALNAPADAVVVLRDAQLEQVLDASRRSDRLRMVLPFHREASDPLHRMFNALQPGSYVRPHRHAVVPKPEVFLVLRGAVDFVVFDDAGEPTHAVRLTASSPEFGVDLPPGPFHTLLVREPDTVLYEVKSGPYLPASDQDFASWAPPEGSPEIAGYLAKLERQLAAFLAR